MSFTLSHLSKDFNENDNQMWIGSLTCIDRGTWIGVGDPRHGFRRVFVVSSDWNGKNPVKLVKPLRIGQPLRCPDKFPKGREIFFESQSSRHYRAHEMIREASKLLAYDHEVTE